MAALVVLLAGWAGSNLFRDILNSLSFLRLALRARRSLRWIKGVPLSVRGAMASITIIVPLLLTWACLVGRPPTLCVTTNLTMSLRSSYRFRQPGRPPRALQTTD